MNRFKFLGIVLWLLGVPGIAVSLFARVPEQKTPLVEIAIPADSLQIGYLANVNAVYENCLCGENPLGGLDRVASLLRQWRKKNPHLQVWDGGDFFNAYPYPELNRLIIRLYRLMNVNLVVLGDQELQQGNASFFPLMGKSLPLLLDSNVKLKNVPIVRKVLLKLKHHRVVVMSYVDESSFLWEKAAEAVELSDRLFGSVWEHIPHADFKVLIFHGDYSRLAPFLRRFSAFDLVLLGHEQKAFVKRNTRPVILAPGADSERIWKISLTWPKQKARPVVTLKQTEVTLKVTPLKEARRLIEKSNVAH